MKGFTFLKNSSFFGLESGARGLDVLPTYSASILRKYFLYSSFWQSSSRVGSSSWNAMYRGSSFREGDLKNFLRSSKIADWVCFSVSADASSQTSFNTR